MLTRRGSWSNWDTALHGAATRGNGELVKVLVEAEAGVNSHTELRRQTPGAECVCDWEDGFWVNVLVAAGATGPFTGGRLLFSMGRMRLCISE